jgi:hypothetical protein
MIEFIKEICSSDYAAFFLFFVIMLIAIFVSMIKRAFK